MSDLLNFPIRSMPRWWRRGYTIAFIVVLSVLLHLWMIWQLPVDYDEPIYMSAAQYYAAQIEEGNLDHVINYTGTREHPPLGKLIYTLPFYFTEDSGFPLTEFYANRAISAFFGVLQILLLSLIDPLAGLLLAFHSTTLKYTSQVYLESLPLFASLVAVFAFYRASLLREEESPQRRWLWISAIALGVSVAGKYTYGLILLPIATLIVTKKTISFQRLILYGLLAFFTFWLLNPYLWNDPINRLVDSLSFHAAYSQGIDVQRAAYPWYQPFIWLSNTVPWHPNAFFFLTSDEVIFWLGVIGVFLLGRQQLWLAVWFLGVFAVLLVWPTKWPQYTVIVYPALALLASSLIRWAYTYLRARNDYWDYLGEMLPQPPRVFWYFLILFVGLLGGGKIFYEYDRALDRRGWTQLLAGVSPLPSNTVYDIFAGADGKMILGTAMGVAIWYPSNESSWGEDVTHYTQANSGLADNRVQAVLEDSQNRLWFGSPSGISLLDQNGWTNFYSTDLGLPEVSTLALVEDSTGGIWAGSISGLAHWDGEVWNSYTLENSSIPDPSVFSLAVQPTSEGDILWVGTGLGVSRVDLSSGKWTVEDLSKSGLTWRGVSDLVVDSQNKVWMATLGGGLGAWDGSSWTHYRVGTSALPTSVVQSVFEYSPDQIWVGLGYPTEPGGLLAIFDGSQWKRVTPSNSGFTGGEPLALERDPFGRLWIGTATEGLQIFDPPQ